MSQEDGLMKTAAWLSAGGECVSFADGEERLWSIDSEVRGAILSRIGTA